MAKFQKLRNDIQKLRNIVNFFIGQTIKEYPNVNPKIARKLIIDKLNEEDDK